MPLRVLIYDGNSRAGETALRSSWAAGARVYRALGRIDEFIGAREWGEALSWCAARRERIAELQFWGHGRWGRALLGDDALSQASFGESHPHRAPLDQLRGRLLPHGESLVWFRTCETFGAAPGQQFAKTLTLALETRAAGHTYVIGALQSGLHGLRPGAEPHWSASEGLARGTPDAPEAALPSAVNAINTVHFMTSAVPAAWFNG
ncbi:MAG: hypothetical protein JNK04_23760 [Myxococcales bacterium]|nr:hypothetical protein [Myxococcales bacterium]